jgi:hypothetical protein
MTHLLRCCCHEYAQNLIIPTCGKVCRIHGAPPVPETGLCAAVWRSAFHLRDLLPVVLGADVDNSGSGSGAAAGDGCGEQATLKQVGLVVDGPFPFPWLFVILEVGALKPMRADAGTVTGRCVMMKQKAGLEGGTNDAPATHPFCARQLL